ncbi:hypothetical protein QNO09_33800 [Streptomyces sp. 378]|uniref:hypothetical protein n=1 Tax=Streptomyces sp. 378 TaxID=3049412 RepID=UPI0024C28D20|nr:hypothetical protein [Streptomyces sp. 378]MDK1348165.1 hypothetical protein [Streptomyces sp. 378]
MKDVIEGKWVKFSTKKMEEAVAKGQEAEGGPAPAPSLDAATQKKLVRALREVVARDGKFKTTGDGDGTEHIVATAPFRTLITDLLGEIACRRRTCRRAWACLRPRTRRTFPTPR